MTAPADNEKKALEEFANEFAKEFGVSTTAEDVVSKIRWYANKAGAVVIVKRGKDRKVLATISPTSGKWSHLYPSWKPILEDLQTKKQSEGVSRMSHDGFDVGAVPEP